MSKAKKRLLELNALLAQTLTNKGVSASNNETTTSLIEKVSEIAVKSGFKCDTGEFVFSKDELNPPAVSHNLKAVPDTVIVWSNDFKNLSETNPSPYSTNTSLGLIWLNGFTGLEQRLTSSVITDNGILVFLTITKGGHLVSVGVPTAKAYTGIKVDKNYINLPQMTSATYWRSGVTYRYFIIEGLNG